MIQKHRRFWNWLCVALSFIVVLATPIATFAWEPSNIPEGTLDFYNLNGIYYYNPGARRSSGCYGEISISGSKAAEKIWSGLISFLTPEQAAGVLGNMTHESGLSPVRHETSKMNAYQPGFDLYNNTSVSYGIGLIQWSFGRRTGVLAYIKSTAPDLLTYFDAYDTYGRLDGDSFLEAVGDDVFNSLVSLELEYLKSELQNTSSYSGIFATTTVEEATNYFLRRVEIPADPDGSYNLRLTSALGYYAEFNDATFEGGGSTACGDVSQLQSYVLKYAWPTYHSAVFTDRMPDYAAAVTRRIGEGKYVGGSVNGVAGIDCGGFVTTLLQDSGFAPDYNGTGYKAGTDTQERWVKDHGWELLNGSTGTQIDTSILQPGDVAFTTGHTFVYVGNIPGFDSNIASASYGSSAGRAPMAGKESLTVNHNGEVVRWYRQR